MQELNAVAVFSPSGLHGPQPLYHPYYDPFFDTVAELGVPFLTHTGAAVFGKGLAAERFQGVFPPYHMTTHVVEAMIASVGLLAYGVLDKRPELKVGFFEAGAGWAPFWISKLEGNFDDMGWLMADLQNSPLETFKQRCMITVEADEAILPTTIDFFDGHSVGWSSDVPHFDCENGGRPDELIESPRLSDDAKKRLLYDNVVEFFDLKVPEAA